jgi:hypothetical protein
VMQAAKRSLQLLDLAFDSAFRAYSQVSAPADQVEIEMRSSERRMEKQTTNFPERRFGERRGRPLKAVA